MLERVESYLDLSDYVESIGVSLVREIDTDKRTHDVVPVIRNAIETVAEVRTGILDGRLSTEDRETGDNDEQENDKLDCRDQVHQTNRPAR